MSSGVDWFDLEARCDFDGLGVGLPKLLEALRRGEQFVVLDDGWAGNATCELMDKFALVGRPG